MAPPPPNPRGSIAASYPIARPDATGAVEERPAARFPMSRYDPAVSGSRVAYASWATTATSSAGSTGLARWAWKPAARARARSVRSEEHTSELQSHHDLVCRLLLEKKKKIYLSSSAIVFAARLLSAETG